MIRAAEILGEVRAPKWRGPTLVVCKMGNAKQEEPEKDEELADAPLPKAHRSKTEAEKERPLWVAIGAAMRAARDRNKWSQKVAGGRLDLSDRMVCDYERGKYAVPEHAWESVERVLGIDVAAMVAEWRAAQ